MNEDKVDEAEVAGDEDDKAKDDPAPKARGRPRAKAQAEKPAAKAKGKAKAKAKGTAKAKAKANSKAKEDPEEGNHNEGPEVAKETSMAEEQPPTDMAVDPKPEVAVPPSDAAKAEVDANTMKPDGDQPKVARKSRARKVSDKTQDSAGSDPSKVPNKRKKTEKTEAAKNSAKAGATEGDPKEAKGDEVAEEKEGAGEEGKRVPKKRTRHAEAQSFARRSTPSTSFGKAKWHALRHQFTEKIRPRLQHYSAHEDRQFTKKTGFGLPCNM